MRSWVQYWSSFALICFAVSWFAVSRANAQTSSQPNSSGSPPAAEAPDAPAPQNNPPAPDSDSAKNGSKKKGAATAPASAAPASTADENPFPEETSKQAAEHTADPAKTAQDAKTTDSRHSAADENPFPEEDAKKAAGASDSGASPPGSPASGSESSKDYSSSSGGRVVLKLKDEGSSGEPHHDTARAKNDDAIADFYVKDGNYRGAVLRYEDAIKYHPDDARALFGLADSERRIGKLDDAKKHYNDYLTKFPKGEYAAQCRKELKKFEDLVR